MAKRVSKRTKAVRSNIDRDKSHSLEEGVKLIKGAANAKFDETIEMAFKLGVDPKHADQQVRSTVSLPKGTGKKVRVLVFAQGDDAAAAKAAGADFVGGEDMVTKVNDGFLDFDVVIATPDMMKFVGRLGKVLGPRGLMPNPKTGSVTKDVGKGVEDFKGGKIEIRANKEGILHARVGKASFSTEDLLLNVNAVVGAVVRAKPSAAKGVYVKSMFISSTMGPGIRLDTSIASGSSHES